MIKNKDRLQGNRCGPRVSQLQRVFKALSIGLVHLGVATLGGGAYG